MIDDVQRADAALAELEVVDELARSVQVGHRLAEFAQQHVRETASSLAAAAVRRRRRRADLHLVERDALQLQRRRDVFDDVVRAAPVAPRPVEAVQVAGRHERADDVRRVRVGRSLRQQSHVSPDERMELLVASCTNARRRNVRSRINGFFYSGAEKPSRILAVLTNYPEPFVDRHSEYW